MDNIINNYWVSSWIEVLVCEDEGKLEQALQHYSSAIALNPECHLAIKNRADVRMAYANRLKEADALALIAQRAQRSAAAAEVRVRVRNRVRV